MFRFFLAVLTLIILVSGCHGCSFIKEKLGIQIIPRSEQNQDQEQEEKRSEPIPVNPSHS